MSVKLFICIIYLLEIEFLNYFIPINIVVSIVNNESYF